jgi:UDP-N-acetylmuramate--alanine ligase
MIKLMDIKNIHFIGIGGIGMSALARFFAQRGAKVSGFDKTETDLTRALQQEGIEVYFKDDIDLLDKESQVVVYTPAIPNTHLGLNWYRDNNYSVLKRSDMLQIISEAMQALCVAGTHGKTTTSTILAHILTHSGVGCNAFLGGISVNYNTNYWPSNNQVAVIEADEYDRSFLKLFPSFSIVTSMDPDHLDIYGTEEEMQKAYVQYMNSIADTLVYKHGLPHILKVTTKNKFSYSLQNDAANFYASDIKMKRGTYTFNFCKDGEELGPMNLNVGGMHNVENTIAATALATLYKIPFAKIAAAIADYKGVQRRFEYLLNAENLVYIDDYAHHPEELRVLISSAKALFPNKKCTVIFQPHLYTRTRDFTNGFAEVLSMADELILLDIYPARELPIEGITSQIILDKVSATNKHILSKDGIIEFVKASSLELLITAGAGDIDKMVAPIANILNAKNL